MTVMDKAVARVWLRVLEESLSGRCAETEVEQALRELDAMQNPGISENVGRFQLAWRGKRGVALQRQHSDLRSAAMAIGKYIDWAHT